ncbi:hypothetical protein K504DRAFT_390631 [Pleomassaria siparia CBS 279.74]|uniref:C2H2-type domain-containing protein n=1 Tax=Pleomassaria siparia CBS 279.74 TaxID=1314801 RepID=A0A6G1JUN4_9PLEO|nr:hypothetical protein K504DRAFT_390631 [Pleomassaria siparia CBS 279.74]
MTNFFPTEAEMALMGQDEIGHLFPGSTCHSPPSIMYSPPLQHQHIQRRPQATESGHMNMYAHSHGYRSMESSSFPPQAYWSNHPSPVPSYSSYPPLPSIMSVPSLSSDTLMHSQRLHVNRPARSHSASSYGSSLGGLGVPGDFNDRPQLSRSLSPSLPDLRAYGLPNNNGTWSCAYPGCTSRAVFTRGCDLRKHHKRHTKSFFCHHEGCPQSTGGGFSSKKDLARHEAKHNPGVLCDWAGCDRVFSRVDNMRDHVKRIHLKTFREPHHKAPS